MTFCSEEVTVRTLPYIFSVVCGMRALQWAVRTLGAQFRREVQLLFGQCAGSCAVVHCRGDGMMCASAEGLSLAVNLRSECPGHYCSCFNSTLVTPPPFLSPTAATTTTTSLRVVLGPSYIEIRARTGCMSGLALSRATTKRLPRQSCRALVKIVGQRPEP